MDVFRKSMHALLIGGIILTASPAMAQITSKIKTGLDAAAPQEYKTSNTYLPAIVAGLIQAALTLVGVILLVLLIYAGFLWMTAAGEGKQVDKAKDIIKNAVMGLIVIFAAYAIADYVLVLLAGGLGGASSGAGNQPQ